MIVNTPGSFDILAFANVFALFKVGYVIFAVLYFLFALIVVRQVALMTDTVITEAGGFLRFLSIIHAIFALGILVFFIFLL
jgi:hypothetical protein